MDEHEFEEHLSQIITPWAAILRAHGSSGDAAQAAFAELLQRYSRAIYCYLLGAVHSVEVADELFQEFALRLVRGDFRNADPARGRFRDFVKTTLFHLVVDHQRRQRRQHPPLSERMPEPVIEPPQSSADEQFTKKWRDELMARAWSALADEERRTGQPLHTVLRFRADHSGMRSPQMSAHLMPQLGEHVTPQWVRKRLHFARQKFLGFVIDEVAATLTSPTKEDLAEELSQLGLLEYCRSALNRRP